MKKNNIVLKEDRISELLPDVIVENILLRLVSSKDRVRVSVLSKRWCALTASFPFLDFSFDEFAKGLYGTSYHHVARNLFYKYVEHSVSRFCRQKYVKNAYTFKLFTVAGNYAESNIIDTCLESILLKGVKALEIMTTEGAYRLPNILTSASSLTSLKVYHCMLPLSLKIDVPNFKSLKVLWLNNVWLDPLVIKHLTASCPLLEELIVEHCNCFKEFRVYGRLQNLKKAHFIYKVVNGFQRIDIDAPNLCEFQLCVSSLEGRVKTSVNLGICKQLRTLLLHGSFFPTSTGLSDFLSNFPILENLSLRLANQYSSLVVSSPSLRKFVLYDECDLEKIDINTPNLLFFSHANYEWDDLNSCQLKNIALSELNACMECDITKDVDTLFFQKLRRFLEKANKFKVLLLDNHFLGKLSLDFDQLKQTRLPPYELEHVKLNLWIEKGLSVLDGVLWCCRPRSLSLTSNFSLMSDETRGNFLKFISEKLLQQEDQGTANIRIEWSFPSKSKIYFCWSSMLIAPGNNISQTVTFIKEEAEQFLGARNNKTVKGLKS